jgi:hypothetical protein
MSARERVLILALIGLVGALIVALAIPMGGDPVSADDDPSRRSALPASTAAPPDGAVIAASPFPRPAVTGPWAAHATKHRGAIGEWFEYECPASGMPGPIWGSAVYTDDSSVCTAAVHMGIITLEAGGTVRIVIRPGLASYTGTTLNGVKAESWGPWDGSFEFAVP